MTSRRGALGLGLLAGAAGLVLANPRARRLGRRWLTVARLGARTAARAGSHQLRRLGADPARRAELDVSFELQSAQDVATTLGQMKGTFMKVGQLVSFVDDGMPEHMRSALAQLQDSAPPMSPELAASVVRSELGDDPSVLFRAWEPTPVAVASIGQVHRAVLQDGRVAAVKVQYPGIAEIMEADLTQLDLGRLVMPVIWPRLDVAAVTNELRARLTEELDYRIEAVNQQDFARWYKGHPFITVPPVIDHLSTRAVLTTAYIEGDRFARLEQRSQADRDFAAEAIFRFVFRSIHDHLSFNGDPHPGNYLFGRDRTVAFLDFGLVKRLAQDETEDLIAIISAAALQPDPAGVRRLSEKVGYFAPGSPLSDELIFQFSSMLWRYLAEDRTTTLTAEWASETVRKYLVKGPEFRGVDRWGGLPPNFVILQRITVGLLAVLGRLSATANWHRIARELLRGEPPASPLGELEAAWLTSHADA